MAARKAYAGHPSYRQSLTSSTSSDSLSELDESEVWNYGADPRRATPGSRTVVKKGSVADGSGGGGGSARSLPVSVPDWAKTLREGSVRGEGFGGGVADEEDEEAEDRIPPHELVARRARGRRVASYSVHEGVGRTLKGRDLSRVRNAIWEKTGFQD
uniref:Senescence regulator n=1 Tax=Kalanchoe fedtschenkoi TaxID=63787 RepID=A0A7N0R8L3_KALFE